MPTFPSANIAAAKKITLEKAADMTLNRAAPAIVNLQAKPETRLYKGAARVRI
jgi:hypothetical protein